MKLPDPIVVAIISASSSLVGGLTVAIFNYVASEKSKARERKRADQIRKEDRETAERSRILDIYKFTYPEKVKAASELMRLASIVHRTTMGFVMLADPHNQEGIRQVESAADDLLLAAAASEWLLGPEIRQVVDEFAIHGKLSPNVMAHRINRIGIYFEDDPATESESENGAFSRGYRRLHTLIRARLYLEEIEGTTHYILEDARRTALEPGPAVAEK